MRTLRLYPAVPEATMREEGATLTVGQELASRVRAAGAFTVGAQTPPAAILWPDGDKRWMDVLPELKALIPEMYPLGDFDPEARRLPLQRLDKFNHRWNPHLPSGILES